MRHTRRSQPRRRKSGSHEAYGHEWLTRDHARRTTNRLTDTIGVRGFQVKAHNTRGAGVIGFSKQASSK